MLSCFNALREEMSLASRHLIHRSATMISKQLPIVSNTNKKHSKQTKAKTNRSQG